MGDSSAWSCHAGTFDHSPEVNTRRSLQARHGKITSLSSLVIRSGECSQRKPCHHEDGRKFKFNSSLSCPALISDTTEFSSRSRVQLCAMTGDVSLWHNTGCPCSLRV